MIKEKRHAFSKDIYLLGKDEQGQKYWLEAPTWDCGWYWGFGYVETYTNNTSPERSRDTSSHSHADNFMSKYFTSWNGSKPILKHRTFTEKEGWEISELFEQFYLLRKMAEYYKDGKSHCADTAIEKDIYLDRVKEINELRLPKVMDRILEILTPKVEKTK